MRRGISIGIDLGTRNAQCACIGADARPVMIPNRRGSLTTPSVVGWDGGWVVGEDAVRLSLHGSASVWWDIKRKVGSDFHVRCGDNECSAQDLLVPLLSVLREDAEAYLGEFVSSCVLAVPACFSLVQREAMTRAAAAAGLRETRIVNEPTAAALAFGREGRFLVLDFGAGTVDLSVVESEGGVWQVLESAGSSLVGGYDFDLAMAEWLRERLRLAPLPPDDSRWRTLVMEAEKVKIALSTCKSCCWTPPALGEGMPSSFEVEREDFERMVRFSIRRLIHVVQRLQDRHAPESILLVGGSARIPLLKDILAQEVIHPECLSFGSEDSIAAGAALYTRLSSERLLLDVLSGDVGFIRDGEPTVLVPAGTPLPYTAQAVFVPPQSGETEISLYQNIGEMQEERTILSVLRPDVSAGEEVALRCSLDTSGLLRLSLRHAGSTTEVPLLPLTREKTLFSTASARRLRELKLRLAPLEVSLTPRQQDRLHSLVHRLENIDDGSSFEILEGLVNSLEAAVS